MNLMDFIHIFLLMVERRIKEQHNVKEVKKKIKKKCIDIYALEYTKRPCHCKQSKRRQVRRNLEEHNADDG